MEKRKLIIDCDTGTDDAVAVMALLLCGKYDVLGISSVHGNRPVDCTFDNNRRLVQYLGMDIPVYKGCASALVRDLSAGRDCNTVMQRIHTEINGREIMIHEKTLDLPPCTAACEKVHACSFIVDTLLESREPIDIVALGPLTNIAVAMRMAPEIAGKIGTLCIMGGGLYTGNRTPVAEANFYDDPEAAEIVLTSGASVLLNPIEANEAGATYTQEDITGLEKLGNRTGAWTAKILRDFIWRCQVLFAPEIDSCCIHDYAAAASLIDPSTVTQIRRENCRVDFSGGMSDGQLVVDRRGGESPDSPVRIVYDMDSEKTHSLLLELISKAD